MATALVPDVLAANGVFSTITMTAVDITGMSFPNTGRELVVVDAGATPSTGDVTVEGVAAADSGRDGTSQIGSSPSMVADDIAIAGPFKPRNWNVGGIVEMSSALAGTLTVGVVRFDPNG